MIRINLLPVRIAQKKEAGRQQLLLFGLVVVFALICNFWWNHSRDATLASKSAKLARTRSEIAQLEKIIGEVKNLRAEQNELKEKLGVLDKLKAGRQGPVRVLDELATILPKRVWLKKFEEKGGSVSFEGSAGTIDDVSAFLTALKRAQYFSAPELKRTSSKADGRFRIVEFTITANVTFAAAAPAVASAAPPAATR